MVDLQNIVLNFHFQTKEGINTRTGLLRILITELKMASSVEIDESEMDLS